MGENGFGQAGYFAPCPPAGNHRYVWTLFALSAPVEPADADPLTAIDVRALIHGLVLDQATLVGTYRRAATP